MYRNYISNQMSLFSKWKSYSIRGHQRGYCRDLRWLIYYHEKQNYLSIRHLAINHIVDFCLCICYGSLFPNSNDKFFCDMSHSINTDIHTHTSIHPYEYMHRHPISMNTSERINRLDLEIHEVGQRIHRYQRRRYLQVKE
jgi:hypothetical protein